MGVLDLGQGRELLWVKPKWSRREFELRAGEVAVATLRWRRGSQAIAQWGASQYRFDCKGWFKPVIAVHEIDRGQDTSEPLATLSRRSGTLRAADGRTFVWQKPKRASTGRWWSGERVWLDTSGTELVRFRPGKHSRVEVIMAQAISAQPELPLLILLGQYLIALAAQDAETASIAASAAVIAGS
jgi:hypothetical protein